MNWPSRNCAELLGGSPEMPTLVGNRCTSCGEPYFPAASGCTRCCGEEFEPLDLGGAGRLWSWTLQMFQPKPPYDGGNAGSEFRPYGVGYVAMECGLKVEARIVADDLDGLCADQPMRLVLEAYRVDADGEVHHTFAFTPEKK